MSDFQSLTAIPNLHACWLRARRNKGACLRVQRFAEDPLRYLTLIQERLRSRTYTFGPYNGVLNMTAIAIIIVAIAIRDAGVRIAAAINGVEP